MRELSGIDELEAVVGGHLGHGDWLVVDQERIDRFAEATGDRQWIHVDPERARRGPYGAPIAHGYLVLSLIPVLTPSVYRVEGVETRINYGLDRVRFPSPVRAGDRVRAGVAVAEVKRTERGTLLTTDVTIECERSDRPACAARAVTLLIWS